MFVDSHAHLDPGPEVQGVLFRANNAFVKTILAIGNGTDRQSLDCAVRAAEYSERRFSYSADGNHYSCSYPEIYATTGIHPHEAAQATDAAYEFMKELADENKIVAWGEIGLDYFYHHSPRDVQQQVFIKQMELARNAKLPIVIHCRPSVNSDDAWQDCLGLIQQHWASSGVGGILHCFTGTWAHAKRALDLGFMISFAGNITFPKAQQIRDAAKQVPLDRILIETDSPYLAPVPHRGKRNEPAFVVETARQLGELLGMETEEIGHQTRQNFYGFFSLHEKAITI